jgi:aspartate ammonia-lyase
MKKRIEKDFLGKVEIPENAHYGSATARAKQNFQISGLTAPKVFTHALGLTKMASFKANSSLGLIEKKSQKAIAQACQEFIDGKFNDQFTLDVFQAGAGTSYNMNANEVIANRANELMKAKKGEYKFVHPNNHINMGQSTNDVIPTATQVAILLSTPALISAIKTLEQELNKHAKRHEKTIKVGRTHLQDAVPISLAQELDSYREAIAQSRKFIEQQAKGLYAIGLGGTAVGTGLNAHPKYKVLAIKHLSTLTKIKFTAAKNPTQSANDFNRFMHFSSALTSMATTLTNLCSNIKLMSSNSKSGLGELTLLAVQAGSSAMPGKVNPSILEAMEMICLQVFGNSETIRLAAQKSQFELNIYCPIIMSNILQSMEILTSGITTLTKFAIKDLKINTANIKKTLEKSLSTATSLVPHLGYQLTAEIAKSALRENRTIKQEVLKRKLLPETKLDEILQQTH